MDRRRVMAWVNAGASVAAAAVGALLAPAALLQGAWTALIGLGCMVAAAPTVLAAVARRRRRASHWAAALHAAAAFLFLGGEALAPAVVATLLFVGDVALASRAGPPPQP